MCRKIGASATLATRVTDSVMPRMLPSERVARARAACPRLPDGKMVGMPDCLRGNACCVEVPSVAGGILPMRRCACPSPLSCFPVVPLRPRALRPWATISPLGNRPRFKPGPVRFADLSGTSAPTTLGIPRSTFKNRPPYWTSAFCRSRVRPDCGPGATASCSLPAHPFTTCSHGPPSGSSHVTQPDSPLTGLVRSRSDRHPVNVVGVLQEPERVMRRLQAGARRAAESSVRARRGRRGQMEWPPG